MMNRRQALGALLIAPIAAKAAVEAVVSPLASGGPLPIAGDFYIIGETASDAAVFTRAKWAVYTGSGWIFRDIEVPQDMVVAA